MGKKKHNNLPQHAKILLSSGSTILNDTHSKGGSFSLAGDSQFIQYDREFFDDEEKMLKINEEFQKDVREFGLFRFEICTSDNPIIKTKVKESIDFNLTNITNIENSLKPSLKTLSMCIQKKNDSATRGDKLNEQEYNCIEEIQRSFAIAERNSDLICFENLMRWFRSNHERKMSEALITFKNQVQQWQDEMRRELETAKLLLRRVEKSNSAQELAHLRISRDLTRISLLSTNACANKLDTKKLLEPIQELHLLQLLLAFHLSIVQIRRHIRPLYLCLLLLQCDEKLGRIDITNLDLDIRYTQSNNKKLEEVHELAIILRKFDEAIDRCNIIYQWYEKAVKEGNLQSFMLIDNEGYLCLKKHDKLNYEWSKRSYYYIRGKKLVMSNKKMSNFVSIADDLSKTSVRYPDSFNSTLCFDLYFVKGFVKVKADTPAEAKNWVSNINNLALKYTKREEEKLRVVEGSHYADNNPDVKKCYRDMKKETDSIHKFESGGSILQMLKGDLRNVQTPDYLPKIKEEIYSVQSLIMNSTIGNMACADCKSHGDLGDVDWVSVNQGICICLACSGKHRSLTVRFSKVKSVLMDKIPTLVAEMLNSLGNRLCNIINEFQMNTTFNNELNRDIRSNENFIKLKYEKCDYLPINTQQWLECAQQYRNEIKHRKRDQSSNDTLEKLTILVEASFPNIANNFMAIQEIDELLSILHSAIKTDDVPFIYFAFKLFPLCKINSILSTPDTNESKNSDYSSDQIAFIRALHDVSNLDVALEARANRVFVFFLFNEVAPILDNAGNTILHRAALARNTEIYELLFKLELINHRIKNKDGKTAVDLLNEMGSDTGLTK